MNNRQVEKGIAITIVCLFVALGILPGASGDVRLVGHTIYVDDEPGEGPGNPPEDCTRIQDAIDNTSDGDTIYVYGGTYYENVVIDKSVDLVGEHRETTIIDGRNDTNVIVILTNNVTMSGFTVQNSSTGFWTCWAIKAQRDKTSISSLKNIHISNCDILNNNGGILFTNTSDSIINDCTIKNNNHYSVKIKSFSDNVTIYNCTIKNNGKEVGGGWITAGSICIDGEYFLCSHITISQCNISDIIGPGIDISQANYVDIYHTTIYANTWDGILIIAPAANISIYNNSIYKNSKSGISILSQFVSHLCSNITIQNNRISTNGNGRTFNAGIYLQDCIDCITIHNNTISLNNHSGVYLLRSSGNFITENTFTDNVVRAAFFEQKSFFSTNYWRGNYWDRPRILPKIIVGKMWIGALPVPWVDFDWRPAR